MQLIKDDRLIIRKTNRPNHSKLYLFYLNENQIGRNKLFITGSSNLTAPGIAKRNEFNVEISDFGFAEAEKYFDDLWNDSVLITEHEEYKKELIHTIEYETLVKQISPFEAYCYVIKNYLETFRPQSLKESIIKLFEDKGYKRFKYQLDAISLALSIIEKYNGVLISDVVGLGKTIIACAVAKHLKGRGIVICPPGLVGDENKKEGWKKYLEEFKLYDWEVRSIGKLEEALCFVNEHNDIEIVIVDEAHRFRNQDTKSYELLKNICRNKKVVLLTATPFNNKPEDLLSLLSLFITPKKSPITLERDLLSTFRTIGTWFYRLGYIVKNHDSNDAIKRKRAKDYYRILFGKEAINLKKVLRKSREIAKMIRDVIEPVTIRRNRLDLLKNPDYNKEVKDLSIVENPIEWFYELTPEQLKFYDEVISVFFAPPDE